MQRFAFFQRIKHINMLSAGTEDPGKRRQTLGIASQLLLLWQFCRKLNIHLFQLAYVSLRRLVLLGANSSWTAEHNGIAFTVLDEFTCGAAA